MKTIVAATIITVGLVISALIIRIPESKPDPVLTLWGPTPAPLRVVIEPTCSYIEGENVWSREARCQGSRSSSP